ncbi:MAG: PD-(D/E)XK nuclease family protein [Halioglobus sp.]|nr:PD-(D/E)XK nuclease family protein [Halioglobus sp.]
MGAASGIGKVGVTLALRGDSPLPEPARDALGEVVVGTHGFLGLLETQLGIPSRDFSFTARLIQYLGCIDRVNHANAFYHTSYQADPFSVARTLLQWRDQWYLAGWRGSFAQDAPGKLLDMAAIEQLAAGVVEPGLGQRIQRVLQLLPGNPVAVGAITLRDALGDFPPLWRQLIRAVGAPLTDRAQATAQSREGTDLHRLQQLLLRDSNRKIRLQGDGTVIALRADSPQASAPLTALLTQSWLAQAPQQSIALLAEARGELLDDTLEHLHSPRLGFSALSPWRPVFQVLPLACELLWEPLNPTALFQFLSHPVGPLPWAIRAPLAQVVANTPGIGSAAWEAAISASLESEDKAKREILEQDTRYWLESPRFSPQGGVDSNTLAERAGRVADWLKGSREASDDPARRALYNIALNQALEFGSAIDRLKAHGRELLTQDNVRRLIEDVRGTGAPITDRGAEVIPGHPRVLRADHAGAFGSLPASAVDNVIWWDCQATDRVQRWPWSRSERAALAANGVQLQSEGEQLEWLGRAWLRPVLAARERCVFILHDDAERHHPTWEQVASLTEGLPMLQIAGADTAAQLGVAQGPLQARSLPPKVRWWQLPPAVTLPQRESESFSSLDAYIHSPYQWLLRYAAGIRPGSLGRVSDGSQLKGSLVHRLYEEYFNAHPAIGGIDPRTIDAWVDACIPGLLQQEGALLLEEGRQAECERFIVQLQESLTTLVEHLQSAGVVSVQMELRQEGLYAGGKLNGSIDLLATRADGTEAVVDIKWGGRKFRREALLDNSYLQLATYAQLRRNNGAASSPALSYFIVMDAHLLSLNHAFFPNAEILKPGREESAAQYWQRLEQTWRWRRAQFDRGLVEVTVTDTEATADSMPGDDGLPMPETSDSFNDYRVLTGWGGNA